MNATAALTNALTLFAAAGIALSLTILIMIALPFLDRHHRWF